MHKNKFKVYKVAFVEFFDQVGVEYERTRRREVVLPLAAFLSALTDKLGPTQAGRICEIHHSTVLYHRRVHEDRMLYSDYRELYNVAKVIVDKASLQLKSERNAIHSIKPGDKDFDFVRKVLGHECEVALDCLVEKLYDDFGIKVNSSMDLNEDKDFLSRLLCNTIIGHVESSNKNVTVGV